MKRPRTVAPKGTPGPPSEGAGHSYQTRIATAVVLLVTVLSLPPLLRLMRPDGLRTE
ncbi:hypothetical protein [Streptomyces sp. NPDC050164]|uniref:hypothetical protein n=1 Tax=Streptomyces sp. NPDC050164 TaxID=3365605 RepID=UPI0037A2BFB9